MKVMMAGGGTGGHIFPALAVAEELRRRNAKNEIVFVGTEQGLEARLIPAAGYPLRTLPAAGFKGVSASARLRSLSLLPGGLLRGRRLLRELQPEVVFGVGGYASGPTMLAAALSGRPTVLFEPNAEPGLANRWLAPLVRAAAVTHEQAATHFGRKAVVTGSPVRAEFFQAKPRDHKPPFTLLVFGGSRGAAAINRGVVEVLDALEKCGLALRFVHQTGERDHTSVRMAYARRGGAPGGTATIGWRTIGGGNHRAVAAPRTIGGNRGSGAQAGAARRRRAHRRLD